jgi:hypothetical protein
MTLLGKILVFVNVAIAFLMLAWAAALYTNRIDWAGKAGKGDQPPGALVEQQARVKAGGDALDVARTRWNGALKGFNTQERSVRAGLVEWEKRRDADRVWYDEQLKAARSGPEGKLDKPIQRVATKDGLPIPDPQNGNRPTMVEAERRKGAADAKGEPLFCYDFYVKALARLSDDIIAAQAEYQKAVRDDITETEKVIGPKGLRQRILDEQEKVARIDEELKDVETRQTNSRVETELLLARRAQLKRRIAELERTAAEEKN